MVGGKDDGMSCPRCQGLCVPADGVDLVSGLRCRHVRCVLCGWLTDPVADWNRAHPPDLRLKGDRRRAPGARLGVAHDAIIIHGGEDGTSGVRGGCAES